MQRHRHIWSIALAALLAAAALALLRQGDPRIPAAHPTAATLIVETMRMLEEDLQAEAPVTQSHLRRAVVAIEQEGLNTAESAYLLARQHIREHSLLKAEAQLRRATELKPDWGMPWHELGSLLARNTFGRTSEAEEVLQRAIELEPEWARAHNTLAVLLRLQGRYEEAEVSEKRALELAPEEVASHNNYANLLISLRRYDEAEHHYRIAQELDPERPKPYYNLACLYAIMGKRDAALEKLGTALDMAPILREDAWDDPDFENLRHDPMFRRLVYGEG